MLVILTQLTPHSSYTIYSDKDKVKDIQIEIQIQTKLQINYIFTINLQQFTTYSIKPKPKITIMKMRSHQSNIITYKSNIIMSSNPNSQTISSIKNLHNHKNLSSSLTSLFPKNNTPNTYHFHRNKKSLKILNLHLKDYKQNNQKQDIQINPKSNSIHHNKMSVDGLDRNNGHQKQQLSNSLVKDHSFNSKCQNLIDNLLLNISIFKKVFAASKKKRQVIQKLYGWDPIFRPIFFNKYNQNLYSQQFRTNISKQSIIAELSLQKKSFTTQNIYNKLRLFLAELISLNMNHQESSSHQQRQKLVQNCSKLRKSLDKLNQDIDNGNIGIKGKRNILKQIALMKQTHIEMANMKVRIKNKAGEIQRLARNTGIVKVNPFYLQEERNVQLIQQFVKNQIGN